MSPNVPVTHRLLWKSLRVPKLISSTQCTIAKDSGLCDHVSILINISSKTCKLLKCHSCQFLRNLNRTFSNQHRTFSLRHEHIGARAASRKTERSLGKSSFLYEPVKNERAVTVSRMWEGGRGQRIRMRYLYLLCLCVPSRSSMTSWTQPCNSVQSACSPHAHPVLNRLNNQRRRCELKHSPEKINKNNTKPAKTNKNNSTTTTPVKIKQEQERETTLAKVKE